MGAGQSADTKLRGDGKLRDAARRAFFKEHGRDPTEEEEHKFQVAYDRDDPTDAHLGPVAAEEADVHRDTASELLQAAGDSEPTDEMLSTFTEKLARAFRRAALEAVSDIETARRELVRRAVEAEKASGDAAAPSRIAFGPPPRPADESATASPAELPRLEREARAEHEKVRVVAAMAHGLWSSTDPELKETKTGRDNLLSLAEDDKKWELKVRTSGDDLAKLSAKFRELHTAAADRVIAEANHSNSYATELEGVCREAYAIDRQPGGDLDYPLLSSDDAADIGLRYESVPWEDLEEYDPVEFDGVVAATRKTERQHIIEAIHAAALAKRERDAAAELKEREAQSRAAEADLLAQLDAEESAPRKKKKKKKKKGSKMVSMLMLAVLIMMMRVPSSSLPKKMKK